MDQIKCACWVNDSNRLWHTSHRDFYPMFAGYKVWRNELGSLLGGKAMGKSMPIRVTCCISVYLSPLSFVVMTKLSLVVGLDFLDSGF